MVSVSPMTNTKTQDELQENLSLSLRCALDLQKILDDERNALKQRAPELISDAVLCKQICVARLAELGDDREAISREFGFDGNDSNMSHLIELCGNATELADTWAQFLDLARSCSELNATNGAAIRVRQGQIDDAIGLLRFGSMDTKTYGPSGEKAGQATTRALTEA